MSTVVLSKEKQCECKNLDRSVREVAREVHLSDKRIVDVMLGATC